MDAKMLYVPQETIIEIFKIASMATARFRPPKTEEEEISLLSETVPKNTKYNTKWGGAVASWLAPSTPDRVVPGRMQE